MLSNLYYAFDRLVDKFGIYKVETIGDGYMLAAGKTTYTFDTHAWARLLCVHVHGCSLWCCMCWASSLMHAQIPPLYIAPACAALFCVGVHILLYRVWSVVCMWLRAAVSVSML